MNELSLREIASRYLGLDGGFSVVRDIFGVPQITGTQSLRAKLEEFLVPRSYLITEPNVRQRMTEYPDIRFRPGDRITVEAGGCVQTGGSGKTWKRYVDPSGGLETAYLYHGLLWIPSATLPLQRMRNCNGRTFEIPMDVYRPENLYLRLGYEDDDYSDNGYDDHDDGTDNQCKGVGPAFVRLTVEPHVPGRPLPPLPPPAPFDVVWRTVDVNGLPLTPKWGAQVTNPGQHPFDPPDVRVIAPGLAFDDDWPVVANLPTAGPDVTTQAPSFNWGVGLKSTFCGSGGHINWGAVTYEGVIRFKDHAGGLTGDDDYNFLLAPVTPTGDPGNPFAFENSGLVAGNFAPEVGGYLLLEFDSDETIDNFESPWWGTFQQAVDDDADRAKNMVKDRYAIVTGLMGLDTAHEIWTEVHPVWALAIRVNDDASDETWAIFVRNWGNEGGCGNHHQEYLNLPGNRYTFRLPWREGMTSVATQRQPNDFHLKGPGTGGPDITPVTGEGVFVTFTLPNPDMPSPFRGLIDGALHLSWQ